MSMTRLGLSRHAYSLFLLLSVASCTAYNYFGSFPSKTGNTIAPLQRDCDGEQYGAGHADGVDGVEQVGEEDDVRLARHAEDAVDRLEDPAEEVNVVEAGEGHEQQVERVSHVWRRQTESLF